MNSAKTDIEIVSCEAFDDQRPGTAGLRKKVRVFQQPHYLETFVQATLDALSLPPGAAVVVGGDGRYHNRKAIGTLTRMLAAAGVSRVVVGQDGILSTPAASHLIRKRGANAGFILTASHNPGGPDGDFGIKFNMSNGGQAPERLTNAVYEATKSIREYRLAAFDAPDLSATGTVHCDGVAVEVVDPAEDYVQLMESLFDFDLMREFLGANRVVFDAMNGVTGPYARAILCDRLGAPAADVLNAVPLEDFGGLHPDPNPVDAAELVEIAESSDAPILLGASDGDGDRNMIIGSGHVVSPGDSVAIMLANAHRIPGYSNGISGAARSMPTSRALDAVAEKLGIPCYETPTGWRFFCNLLDDGRIGICGEESFGTSSAHVREKDGLWAFLFWLNLVAATGHSVQRILDDHWTEYGRNYFQRRDYFIEDASAAAALIEDLKGRLPGLPGKHSVAAADRFDYTDPVDGSVSTDQGIRVFLDDGSRIVYRLSGTGTSGATLRVYLERIEVDGDKLGMEADVAFAGLAARAHATARITDFTGLESATAII